MVILHNEAALTNSHMPVVEAVVMVSCNYSEAVDELREGDSTVQFNSNFISSLCHAVATAYALLS